MLACLCTLKTAYTKHLKYVKRKIETKRGAVEIQRWRKKQTKQHQPSDVNAIRSEWPSKKERRVDALALRADERRDKLRKAAVRSKYPLTRRCLNGETYLSKPQVSWRQSITSGREPGELKHLSSRRKRKQHVILWVAASENGRAQTSVRACWGSDRGIDSTSLAERFWESRPERVKAP